MRVSHPPKYTVKLAIQSQGIGSAESQNYVTGNGSSQRVAAARAAEALIAAGVPTPCTLVLTIYKNR